VFLRTVKVRSSSGVLHEYVRLVESQRHGARTLQRVVANLGRKDALASLLPALTRLLRGESAGSGELGGVEPIESLTWGPVLIARALFEELGLASILEGGGGEEFAERVFVLVANRLRRPESEHGLARWLETDFVCDRAGRRWVPQWEQRGRVKVSFAQLQRWYRTLDRLIAAKSRVEVALFERLRDLFSLRPDLVFYDLTSVYFEGRGPAGFALHGHSRDEKPRNPQVLVGVVMVQGLPIAHHVFAGNRRDSVTVPTVLEDLERRFGFRRVVFVGDRGMVTVGNLERLRREGHGYLVGLQRRRRPQIQRLLDRARGPWTDCPVGITASEKTPPPRTRVQEVEGERQGVRVFVVESEERLLYERSMRERAMARTAKELAALEERVRKGELLRPELIGAAAARILQRHHGHRYFAWKIEGKEFRFFEDPNLEREKRCEGRYLLQTEEKDLTAPEAVQTYKELADVERGFRDLKDPIGLRPIWHQTESRVRAHIFVAALSFLLQRVLERRLKEAGAGLSAVEALGAAKTVRWVRFKVDGDGGRVGVTPGSPRAQQVLAALRIKDRRPPQPPEGQREAV